jgi:dihydrofolate reductase
MRAIVNSTYITIDGIIQDPGEWPSLGSFDDEGNQIQTELLERCDAVLMGRETYESFAPVWSARSGDPMSDRMNSLPKYVVSTTLVDPTWKNTHVIAHEPIEAIRELRSQDGGNIVQYGFGRLSHALMEARLLDELRLWVHPFVLGSGSADDLLYRAGSAGMFEVADAKRLASGVVILSYLAAARS